VLLLRGNGAWKRDPHPRIRTLPRPSPRLRANGGIGVTNLGYLEVGRFVEAYAPAQDLRLLGLVVRLRRHPDPLDTARKQKYSSHIISGSLRSSVLLSYTTASTHHHQRQATRLLQSHGSSLPRVSAVNITQVPRTTRALMGQIVCLRCSLRPALGQCRGACIFAEFHPALIAEVVRLRTDFRYVSEANASGTSAFLGLGNNQQGVSQSFA